MNRSSVFIFIGVFLWTCSSIILYLAVTYFNPVDYLDEGHVRAGDSVWRCNQSAEQEVEELRRRREPEAMESEVVNGAQAFYLRYPDDLLIISVRFGGQECFITRENMDRINSGFYIYLGDGFRPASPSDSSGGNSGSAGGVK